MSRTIHQTITLKGATPEELFNIFMDAKKHGELIGAKVVMSRKTGGRFTALPHCWGSDL